MKNVKTGSVDEVTFPMVDEHKSDGILAPQSVAAVPAVQKPPVVLPQPEKIQKPQSRPKN